MTTDADFTLISCLERKGWENAILEINEQRAARLASVEGETLYPAICVRVPGYVGHRVLMSAEWLFSLAALYILDGKLATPDFAARSKMLSTTLGTSLKSALILLLLLVSFTADG